MDWRYTQWWGVLLGGIGGAVLSGLVAAGTAWLVVSLTSKHQRRDALVSEARQALNRLYMLTQEIRDQLVDDANANTDGLERGLRVELVGARALVASLDLAEDDEQLRVQVYTVLGGAKARKEGEPPAAIITPYADFRRYMTDLIRRLGR